MNINRILFHILIFCTWKKKPSQFVQQRFCFTMGQCRSQQTNTTHKICCVRDNTANYYACSGHVKHVLNSLNATPWSIHEVHKPMFMFVFIEKQSWEIYEHNMLVYFHSYKFKQYSSHLNLNHTKKGQEIKDKYHKTSNVIL